MLEKITESAVSYAHGSCLETSSPPCNENIFVTMLRDFNNISLASLLFFTINGVQNFALSSCLRALL